MEEWRSIGPEVNSRSSAGCLDTVEHIETTLLGVVTPKTATLADRKHEAETLLHAHIHEALKQLRVLSTVRFHGCLMVNGLGPAIRFDILPK
ncbi:hypothetical protein B8W72_18080 [Pseudomonas putida]|uniref:Uncharacterized protein n=1 Tax=Pseudomonas putida TaxID=303 RepID=A0A1Y3KVV1_PSEPU|nr:hypothetical protein B8W72_18080 [Pseudomonas putida]